MREMQLNCLYFTMYALWMQVLVLPQWTQGLSCFSCNSKTDQGCENDELNNGPRNMFSEKCLGSDAVCIKQSIVVKHYYEEHYSRVDMKRYYAALDKAAECRGTVVSAGPGVTSAPGGNGTTTGLEAGNPSGTAAAGSGAGDSQRGDGGAAGTTPGAPAVAAATEAGDGDGGGRRRRAVAKNCPEFPSKFPESLAVVERNDQRWVYSCGNRTAWAHGGPMDHCHTHSDGILLRTICVCVGHLCNGATLPGIMPFLVLVVALMHLQGVIG